jgi:hypothetical protein
MGGQGPVNVLMVRARIKQENVADVEAAVSRLFAAIREARLEGIRYVSSLLSDGVTFVALLEAAAGVENPLLALPENQQFQAQLRNWVAEPPTTERMTVVGSYRLFGDGN